MRARPGRRLRPPDGPRPGFPVPGDAPPADRSAPHRHRFFQRTSTCYNRTMIERVVTRHAPPRFDEARANREHWRSRPMTERAAAVEILRRQFQGNAAGVQRSARVLEQVRG